RICVANEWLDKDPFKSYKITTTETSRHLLLQSALETLNNKHFNVRRLAQVRDIFLFSCYTVPSYSDLMLLTQQDVSIGIDGEQWIFTTRIKTDSASRIPLLPMAREIIKKYAKEPDLVHSGRLLPKLSNQRLNGYLKEISDLCGFNKDL